MIEALLERIGLDKRPEPTVEGLHTLHRAYLTRLPYEAIAVQLGETGPLDAGELAARVCADGRGGYCFELNVLLGALLRTCGFSVTHHQAVVGDPGPTNHMTLQVEFEDGRRWVADAGLGEGFLDPLLLREGSFTVDAFTFTLAREDGGTWWMGHHAWGSFNGFRMAQEASPVSAFEVHHRRLATHPESSFVKTLVVQRPRPDRIDTLRARTLSSTGPRVDAKRVLERDEFGPTLAEVFGITVAGERLERLWTQAVAQHDAFLARV